MNKRGDPGSERFAFSVAVSELRKKEKKKGDKTIVSPLSWVLSFKMSGPCVS